MYTQTHARLDRKACACPSTAFSPTNLKVEVEHAVDMLILMLPPAGGDDLQGKKGASGGRPLLPALFLLCFPSLLFSFERGACCVFSSTPRPSGAWWCLPLASASVHVCVPSKQAARREPLAVRRVP